jgi:DNA-binding response OmpR family regulator
MSIDRQKEIVLVIDDEPDWLESIKAALDSDERECVCFHSWKDAAKKVPSEIKPHGPVPEQLDSFVLICYDFEGVIMELFVLCKDARQWSGLLQRSSIDSGL